MKECAVTQLREHKHCSGLKVGEKMRKCSGLKVGEKMRKRRGFTIIEVIASIVVVTFVIVATTVAAISINAGEKRDEQLVEAKDIANYALEYIISRNATRDNTLGFGSDQFGNDDSHPLPGLIDIDGNPLSINTHPATPTEKFSDKPSAFYFSLQGVVSLGENDYIVDANPSLEDKNLSTTSGKYYTLVTDNPLLVKFPLTATINGQDNPSKIKLFNPGADYLPRIFKPNDPDDCPYFTNDTSLKKRTMDYTGYRVLIKVVARKQNSTDPDHAQWFDIDIRVYWMEGKNEREYSLKSKLTTYGGG